MYLKILKFVFLIFVYYNINKKILLTLSRISISLGISLNSTKGNSVYSKLDFFMLLNKFSYLLSVN
jgi:hypothetical protein